MTGDLHAYQHSLSLLHRCLTPAGFVASPTNIDNYARVWARDGVISGLAALASGDHALSVGMLQTLLTLAQHQGPHGEIPSNVTLDGSEVSYGRLSGRVDALLWYVIGVCAYIHHVDDSSAKERFRASVERALFLAGCWEFNNRGLIYTPIAGNWADEYIQQGYVLSDQLLYEGALRSAGAIFDTPLWQEKASHLKQMLAVNYWPRAALLDNPLVYHPHAYRYQVSQHGDITHWLPSFSPSGYATYFDGLAHALALLAGLGDEDQRHRAEAYVQALEQQTGSALLPAFWPVIRPGDPHWSDLQSNHLYGQMKNQPYMYHNGGLWPVLTGLYVVGLVCHGQQERAGHLLEALNAANAQGQDNTQWEFAEYHHGQTHLPLGTKYLAWSAAAGVLAHQAVFKGITPWPFTLVVF
jgi:Alkaline and neutral invertase